MVKIKNIIFDLGGVIINIRSEQDWYRNFMTPLLGESGLQNAIERKFFEWFELGNLTTNDFYKNLKSLSEYEFSFDDLITAWNGRLLAIPEERIDLLYQLAKSYNLFLLSNTNAIHQEYILHYIKEKFDQEVFEEVFQTCYYSHELQLVKPAKEIYERVLADAKIAPNHTLFIDDSVMNLEEPQLLGISTIHFKNDELFRLQLFNHIGKFYKY
ncbi:MAG: HAD family phosphatase [Chitinophagales bacterium]